MPPIARGARLAGLAVILAGCAPAEDRPVDTMPVELRSYSILPPNFQATTGPVRFAIENVADEVHGFRIEGPGVREGIDRLEPGTSDTLTVDLDTSSEYRIYCPVDDHEERGMVARINVGTSSPAGVPEEPREPRTEEPLQR